MKKIFLLTCMLAIGFSSFAQSKTDAILDVSTLTTIEFEEPVFNWGKIEQGEIIQNVFTFKNTGHDPLIISNAKGSCGCTVPRWPKEPIMPGESATLLVRFDSNNKKGLQSKRVTITTNTEPINTYLTIKGEILVPEKKEVVAEHRTQNDDIDATSINIYPNPASEDLHVDLNEYTGKQVKMEIYNFEGLRLANRTVDSVNSDVEQFDISDFVPGTYAITIKVDGLQRLAKQFTVIK